MIRAWQFPGAVKGQGQLSKAHTNEASSGGNEPLSCSGAQAARTGSTMVPGGTMTTDINTDPVYEHVKILFD